MAPGKSIGDLMGPDLGAVGNAATVSKATVAAPQALTSFTVKKGDDGGVLVCEYRDRQTPEGRRPTSFKGGKDYKETPFTPEDGASAQTHIGGLLGEMGVSVPPSTAPEPELPEAAAPPMPTARPPMVAARGPRGAAVAGPMGAAPRGPFAARNPY